MRVARTVALVSAFALAPAVAHAQRVLVLRVNVTGGRERDLPAKLRRCIVDGVQRTGAAALDTADPGTCPSAECVTRSCEVAGAHGAVRVGVAVQGSKRFTVRVDLYDGRGTAAGHGENLCSPCAEADLCETVASTVADLADSIRGLQPRPARLRVATTPAGAQIAFGERRLGTSPVEADLPPGDGVVHATLSGYRDAERAVTLAPGTPTALELRLDRLAGPAPVAPGPHRPSIWPSLALGVLGLGAGGFGGYLIATDGSCTARSTMFGGCTGYHRNEPLGFILAGAGVAALGSAILYLLLR